MRLQLLDKTLVNNINEIWNLERLRTLFPTRLKEASLGFLFHIKSMRVRVKEKVRKKEERKILGFILLMRVEVEVNTKMLET